MLADQPGDLPGVLVQGCSRRPVPSDRSPEARAVAFLSAEVPAGRARTIATPATTTATRRGHFIKHREPGYRVPEDALADTTAG